MTSRGLVLLGAMRRNLELLTELDKSAPADVEMILGALVAHMRAWKPMLLLSFDTGPVAKVELEPEPAK